MHGSNKGSFLRSGTSMLAWSYDTPSLTPPWLLILDILTNTAGESEYLRIDALHKEIEGYMTAIECAEEQGSEPSDTRAFASRHSNGFQQARYIRASKRSWTG
eukprot:m.136374 g.136374  ORF g.136374 m.136374 type:complete len:103 (+) comp16022_c2_seq30:1842-2150(+)